GRQPGVTVRGTGAMTPPLLTHDDLADAMTRLCLDAPVDVALEAVADTLARLIVAFGAPPKDALDIVARVVWGRRRPVTLRDGEPDPYERELEDLNPPPAKGVPL